MLKEIHLKDMRRSAEQGTAVSEETALAVLQCGVGEMPEVMACASALRKRRFGDGIQLCSIYNAKSGACSEDCFFCAQSSHHSTHAEIFGLRSREEISAVYREISALPVGRLGLVTSGKALTAEDIQNLCDAVKSEPATHVAWCASFGCLDVEAMRDLKKAGFRRFHHNLESSPSYFPTVCSTHDYQRRIDTVRAAKEAGLEVCCGGILGLGESLEQRVEFAAVTAREAVESIPLNFLIPIEGTRTESLEVMKPMDMLRTIAMFRFMNPAAEVKIAAGRTHLRDLQSMVFLAGASGIMMGPLLTVSGRDVAQDLRMLEDLEFTL